MFAELFSFWKAIKASNQLQMYLQEPFKGPVYSVSLWIFQCMVMFGCCYDCIVEATFGWLVVLKPRDWKSQGPASLTKFCWTESGSASLSVLIVWLE